MKGRHAEPGSKLAQARMSAHKAFDPKWQSQKMSRSNAYQWLARELGIPKHGCHMLLFNEEQCARVVQICIMDAFEVLE